jgi:hypothetical protein
VLAAALLGLGAAPAAGATWTPVAGAIDARPVAAAADGSGVLVASHGRRFQLVVHRISGGRFRPGQVIARGRAIRDVHVLARADGSAVVVWSQGRVLSAYRPTRSARFGPRRAVAVHAGAATGAASGPAVARSGRGEILAAWWGGPAGGRLGIQTAALRRDGSWTTPVDVAGDLYPQGLIGSPEVGVVVAAAPDGGFGAVWRQPASAPPGSVRPETIAAAARDPSGAWRPPVALGTGDVISVRLAATATGGEEVVGAWAQSETFNPDGTTAANCAVTVTASPGRAPARSDLACATESFLERLRLIRTPDRGLLAAMVLDARVGPRPRTAIQVLRRAPGAIPWSAPATAVGDALGSSVLDDLAIVGGPRALLLAHLAEAFRPRDTGRVRAVVMSPAGAILRRISGPSTPRGVPRGTDSLVALATGPRQAVLFRTGRDSRRRASLLRLGPSSGQRTSTTASSPRDLRPRAARPRSAVSSSGSSSPSASARSRAS